MTIHDFLARFGRAQRAGNGWDVRCPAHDDAHASLSVTTGEDGRILLHCHAGCACESIVASLGIEMRDLFVEPLPSRNGPTPQGRGDIVAEYDYVDEENRLVFQVVRIEPGRDGRPKDFVQRRPNGKGGWSWKIGGIRRVLYRLPEVIAAARAGRTVIVVEGEKDTDRLAAAGLCATTNPGGSEKWRGEYGPCLEGGHVVVLADNDAPGRKHARQVARSVFGRVVDVRIVELPNLPEKGDVSDWLDNGGTIDELKALVRETPVLTEPPSEESTENETDQVDDGPVSCEDFYAYMPMHNYIFIPARDVWPASSVNARVPPIVLTDSSGNPRLKENGQVETLKAAAWLDVHRPVEQMTWAPGMGMVIADRLISDGGWIDRPGCSTFNLYRPPNVELGAPKEAELWLFHVRAVYPDDHEHIVLWLAHRVQRPHEKINHALFLGGAQGIGKDTLLYPVRYAVGQWNVQEILPPTLTGRFNGFAKAVILCINEVHDLGDVNRYTFYERLKAYTAAPPPVIRVDEKHLREYVVPNVCGVILTSNHKVGGLYLVPDDRRHYVAWSNRTKEEFPDGYWTELYGWYEAGGLRHVAAYLAQLDIESFNPKAPPLKTEAFWAIVDAGRAPEDAELADAIERLDNPDALTLGMVAETAPGQFGDWLRDRRNSRQIPHRLEEVGYVAIRNDANRTDGRWKIGPKRHVIYAKAMLSRRDQLAAAQALVWSAGTPST